jgi:hypothetical protein
MLNICPRDTKAEQVKAAGEGLGTDFPWFKSGTASSTPQVREHAEV